MAGSNRVLFSLFLSAAAFTPARAQTAPSLWDRLPGHWVMTGTIDGRQTTHDLDADLVLKSGYVRLHEVSREKDRAGGPEYEAIIIISRDPKSGDYAALWLDNTSAGGLSGPIARAKPTATSIPFIFDFGGNHVFRNTFTYTAKTDTWEWTLDDDRNGTLTPFARLKLTRKR
jgi:hypothetical protein